MRRTTIAVTILACLAASIPAKAQTEKPSGQKTLAATMNVYVFPKEGQNSERQSQHEAECYQWAVQNTGTDPFELSAKLEQQKKDAEETKKQAAQAGAGAGAKGAVRGAAAGALIGEIVDNDAGGGAAYGAAAGMIASRRRARGRKQQANQQADQQTKQTEKSVAEQSENFKKAFSVCLEAKSYLVKY